MCPRFKIILFLGIASVWAGGKAARLVERGGEGPYFQGGPDSGSNSSSIEYLDESTTKAPFNVWLFIYKSVINGLFDLFHFMFFRPDSNDEILKGCYTIATTYMSAIDELRNYYQIRLLYMDNVEYEVGYVSYEIISKYQRMLEIFYLVQTRFLHNDTGSDDVAPATYILYMYSNVLELSKVVMHQCDMLHDLESKYAGQKSVFHDYEIFDGKANVRQDVKDYERHLRDKRKEKKKQLKKFKKLGLKPPAPSARPKGPFPLNYGWSIEDW